MRVWCVVWMLVLAKKELGLNACVVCCVDVEVGQERARAECVCVVLCGCWCEVLVLGADVQELALGVDVHFSSV